MYNFKIIVWTIFVSVLVYARIVIVSGVNPLATGLINFALVAFLIWIIYAISKTSFLKFKIFYATVFVVFLGTALLLANVKMRQLTNFQDKTYILEPQ